MRYLSAQELLVLHAKIIDETGGLHGVRDVGLLASAVERPQMRFGRKELYRGVFTKAACYFESIARNHAFLDGNKRTAVIATARFLASNGYELNATNRGVVSFALRTANGKADLSEIAAWLKRHSHHIRK